MCVVQVDAALAAALAEMDEDDLDLDVRGTRSMRRGRLPRGSSKYLTISKADETADMHEARRGSRESRESGGVGEVVAPRRMLARRGSSRYGKVSADVDDESFFLAE